MTDGVIVEKIPVNRFFFRKVKFWFGMYVWQSITEERGIAYEEMGGYGDDEFIVDVLYYAAEYGSLKDRRKVLNKDVIKKAYELMPQKQLQRIVDVMLKSRITGGTIIGALEKSKKKQAPKKSKTPQ